MSIVKAGLNNLSYEDDSREVEIVRATPNGRRRAQPTGESQLSAMIYEDNVALNTGARTFLEKKLVQKKEHNIKLKAKIAKLEAENVQLKEHITKLEAKDADREKKIAKLEAKLANLEMKDSNLEEENALRMMSETSLEKDKLKRQLEEAMLEIAKLKSMQKPQGFRGKQPCRYGDDCTRPNCNFEHPERKQQAVSSNTLKNAKPVVAKKPAPIKKSEEALMLNSDESENSAYSSDEDLKSIEVEI